MDLTNYRIISPYYFINKKEEKINTNEGISTELRIKENQNKNDNRYAFLKKIELNNNKSGDKLFKLNYQFINRLNREQDLKFLNMK